MVRGWDPNLSTPGLSYTGVVVADDASVEEVQDILLADTSWRVLEGNFDPSRDQVRHMDCPSRADPWADHTQAVEIFETSVVVASEGDPSQ